MPRARVLEHLEALVACDTRNPPRESKGIDALFAYVKDALSRAPAKDAWVVDEVDLGEGCRWLHARRGNDPHVPLVNIHVDTVPLDAGWEGDPFRLRVTNEHAIGLGACDIKGALACFLDAVADVAAPAALLLTTDDTVENEILQRRARGERIQLEERYRNALTRCIGQPMPLEVEVGVHPLQTGDQILVCSDGISRVLDDAHLARRLDEGRPPALALGALIADALSCGGPDNATGVLVRIDSL